MEMLDPGRMRDKLTFQRPTSPSGGRLNAPKHTEWQDFLIGVRAELQDVLPSRSEGIADGAVNTAGRPARIRMYRRPGIASDMRILVLDAFDNVARTLRITAGPAFIGEHREGIELMAEEVSGAGDVAP